MLSKLRHFIPSSVLVNIYNALITAHLTYGLISWGNACKTYLDKILIPASKTCTTLSICCKQTRSHYSLIRKSLSIAIKFAVLWIRLKLNALLGRKKSTDKYFELVFKHIKFTSLFYTLINFTKFLHMKI